MREDLYTGGHRYEFVQAVRLLEALQPGSVSVGTGPDPSREAVRFSSNPSIAFQASDVLEVVEAQNGGPARVVINFLTLGGPQGPLPRPFTELLIERISKRDNSLRDFLDIFHHRLGSLFYQGRRRVRMVLHQRSPEQTPIGRYGFSLIGLGTPGLRNRLGVDDRALLAHVTHLARPTRTLGALESSLSALFSVPVKGEPFVGRWQRLEEDQVTRLGRGGTNRTLGRDAVLGTRVWDAQGLFELRIGPLSMAQFRRFLPDGDAFQSLRETTRFFSGPSLDFRFRLQVRASEVPESRLGTARLGWTSWLRTRQPERDDSQVVLASTERVGRFP